jgi:septal ring-binding cell division protein DamX
MTARAMIVERWRHLRAERGGQSGFVIMAGLAVWTLVGGLTMAALLSMTMLSTNLASSDDERAQQLRAIDGALETAVVAIQVDPSGRVGLPAGDGTCVEPVGGEQGMTYADGLGTTVVVSSTCTGSTDPDATHEVALTARVDDPDEVALLVGSAQLEVTPLVGPGNDVAVLSWSLTAPRPTPDGPPSTTTPTTTTTTSTTTTTTTPTTTSSAPAGVTWTSRVTSEWQSGYCVQVDVTNNARNTQKWSLQHSVKGSIYAFWNARYTRNGDLLSVEGEQWNQSLKSGESTNFGWCSNF